MIKNKLRVSEHIFLSLGLFRLFKIASATDMTNIMLDIRVDIDLMKWVEIYLSCSIKAN